MDKRVNSGHIFESFDGAGDRYSEEASRKWHGKFMGFVTKNEDPDQLGRVKIKVPSMHKEGDETDWAYPCGVSVGKGEGFFDIPKVGEPIIVEFIEGHRDNPIWTKGWFSKKTPPPDYGIRKEKEIDKKASGEKMKRPTNAVYKRDGFVVEIDGTSGQEKLRFFDETTGAQVRIDRKRKNVIITDGTESNNKISLEAGKGGRKITVQDGAGSVVMMDAEKGDVYIAAAKNLTLMAGENFYLGSKKNMEMTIGKDSNISILGNSDWDTAGSHKLAKSSSDVNIANGNKAAIRTDDPLAASTAPNDGPGHTHELSPGKAGTGSSKVKIG